MAPTNREEAEIPTIEKDKATQAQREQRFTRAPNEMQPPRAATSTSAVMLIAGLVAAAFVIVGIVLVAAIGDTSNGDPANAPAKPAAAAPAKRIVAPSAPTPAATIAVTLKEFTISPTPAIGRAGTHHVPRAQRRDDAPRVRRPTHEQAGRRPAQGNEASETGNVGEIPGLAPGATKTLRLRLKAGHYALICNMPGHYMAGQRIDLRSGDPSGACPAPRGRLGIAGAGRSDGAPNGAPSSCRCLRRLSVDVVEHQLE